MKYFLSKLKDIKQKINTEESKRLVNKEILFIKMKQIKERFGVSSIEEAKELLKKWKQELQTNGVDIK